MFDLIEIGLKTFIPFHQIQTKSRNWMAHWIQQLTKKTLIEWIMKLKFELANPGMNECCWMSEFIQRMVFDSGKKERNNHEMN